MTVEYLHATSISTLMLVMGLNSLALELVLHNTMCISSMLNFHKKQDILLLIWNLSQDVIS